MRGIEVYVEMRRGLVVGFEVQMTGVVDSKVIFS
jgi:hypothetical protein